MDDSSRESAAASLVSNRTRVVLWVLFVSALGATFFAYDQVALAVQWVVMKLC
jgi:hypothetical protein